MSETVETLQEMLADEDHRSEFEHMGILEALERAVPKRQITVYVDLERLVDEEPDEIHALDRAAEAPKLKAAILADAKELQQDEHPYTDIVVVFGERGCEERNESVDASDVYRTACTAYRYSMSAAAEAAEAQERIDEAVKAYKDGGKTADEAACMGATVDEDEAIRAALRKLGVVFEDEIEEEDEAEAEEE